MYIVYCGQKLIHLITWILRQQFLHHNVLCLFMNLVLNYVNSNSCLNFMQIFKKCMGWELYLFGNSKYIMLQSMLYNIVYMYVLYYIVGHTYFKIFVLGRFPPKREPKKKASRLLVMGQVTEKKMKKVFSFHLFPNFFFVIDVISNWRTS